MTKPSDAAPVLITGCSTGIGRASALAFSAAGYRTVATARNLEDIEDLRLRGCEVLPLDVSDEAQRQETVETVERLFGPVGVLVNNAAYPQYGPIEEIPLEKIRYTFETNFTAYVRMAQLVIPGMRQARAGRIVNVSSVAGRVGNIGSGIYHATKFAIEGMTESLRPEVRPFGIDVVNILPGPIDTNFLRTILASIPDTGPQSPYATFKRRLADWARSFLKPGGFGVLTADEVANVILRAATAERPRTRYSVGFIARTGPIGRAMTPDRVVDAILGRSMSHW
jgi:NAD(P)-dependent dehydrogenase (short-subunit alcohol dehydrogenase family)